MQEDNNIKDICPCCGRAYNDMDEGIFHINGGREFVDLDFYVSLQSDSASDETVQLFGYLNSQSRIYTLFEFIVPVIAMYSAGTFSYIANGTTYSYTTLSDDTPATVVTKLNLLNSNIIWSYVSGFFYARALSGYVLTQLTLETSDNYSPTTAAGVAGYLGTTNVRVDGCSIDYNGALRILQADAALIKSIYLFSTETEHLRQSYTFYDKNITGKSNQFQTAAKIDPSQEGLYSIEFKPIKPFVLNEVSYISFTVKAAAGLTMLFRLHQNNAAYKFFR